MENEHEIAVPAPADEPPSPPVDEPADPPETGGVGRFAMIAAGVGLVAVLALQAFTLVSAGRTRDEVTALNDRVAALDDRVAAVGSDVAAAQTAISDVGDRVKTLAEESVSPPAASGASAAEPPAAPAGMLPPFEQGQPDAALGVKLGDVSGHEYYTDANLTVDPTDGKARAWLIWAHWCPHCQREVPAVSDWYREHSGDFADVELVSVTSSIDPGRGNPLEPYLDELQTPFPVLVDSDGSLAQQFGVTAFPFWVFTSGDGTTALRVAGDIPVDQLAEILTQLRDLSP